MNDTMEDLALEYKKQYKASRQKMEQIAKDTDLKSTVRRQKIDEEDRRIKEVARQYRHKALASLENTVKESEKALFNLKAGGVEGFNGEAKMNQRDAIDRSLRYSKEQLSEAYQMFSDAEDKTMVSAIAYRAYKTGKRDVLDSYIESDEQRQEQYGNLISAKQKLNPGSGSIPRIQGQFTTPFKPPVQD